MKKVLYILAIIIVIVGIFWALRPRVATSNGATNDNKILVAYFSATGNTKSVASTLAAATGADLFEIVPEQPYTNEDLNWHNDKSRSSVEMGDRSSRPAIASKIADISQYKIVFVGSPIWWGREPSIIDTFIESYDFAGKTVIPFVTSGSSDIGDYGANLQSLAPNAKVLTGKRFPIDVSDTELKTWADEQMQ
ncbi:MAG: flavodoxin [Alphaproteobacteria bacterium]|nr:flavodoxin [Alphaproteobacteria bacterium]